MAYFLETESLPFQKWKLQTQFMQLSKRKDMYPNFYSTFWVLLYNFSATSYDDHLYTQALFFTLQEVLEFQSNNNLITSNKYSKF